MNTSITKDIAVEVATHNGGFLTLDQVQAIAAEPTTRLTPILVRCGCGRFTAPAQDVLHFIAIIERDAKFRGLGDEMSDYVRDCSFPAKRQNSGYQIIGSMRYPNPLDTMLETVMGVNEFGACVVWTYNAQSNGYSNGQYFTMDDAVTNRLKANEYFEQTVRSKFPEVA